MLTTALTGKVWQTACIALAVVCVLELVGIGWLLWGRHTLKTELAEARQKTAETAEAAAIVEANRDRLEDQVKTLAEKNAQMAKAAESQAKRSDKAATRVIVKRVKPIPFDAGISPAEVNQWTLARLQSYSP